MKRERENQIWNEKEIDLQVGATRQHSSQLKDIITYEVRETISFPTNIIAATEPHGTNVLSHFVRCVVYYVAAL